MAENLVGEVVGCHRIYRRIRLRLNPGAPIRDAEPRAAEPNDDHGSDRDGDDGGRGLWRDGIILGDSRFVDADGAVSMKFGWWRVERGRIQITGLRRDASAPPAIGDVSSGYGNAGFQASGVRFPTEGCWAITGTVGSTSLTFGTFVIKVPAKPSVAPTP